MVTSGPQSFWSLVLQNSSRHGKLRGLLMAAIDDKIPQPGSPTNKAQKSSASVPVLSSMPMLTTSTGGKQASPPTSTLPATRAQGTPGRAMTDLDVSVLAPLEVGLTSAASPHWLAAQRVAAEVERQAARQAAERQQAADRQQQSSEALARTGRSDVSGCTTPTGLPARAAAAAPDVQRGEGGGAAAAAAPMMWDDEGLVVDSVPSTSEAMCPAEERAARQWTQKDMDEALNAPAAAAAAAANAGPAAPLAKRQLSSDETRGVPGPEAATVRTQPERLSVRADARWAPPALERTESASAYTMSAAVKWGRKCAECSEEIDGAAFMLHDRAYCCERHRLVASRRDFFARKSTGIERTRSDETDVQRPMHRAESVEPLAATGGYALCAGTSGLSAKYPSWL